jgi:hypothetical protein
MIVDALSFSDIPLQEPDQGTARAEVSGQGGTGDTHQFLRNRVRIVSNHHPAARPGDPVEIGDSTFDIHPAAIRADGPPPVVDAGDSYR